MPFPFSFLLDRTVTVQRNTPTQGASTGAVDSWANISGATNVIAAIIMRDKRHEMETQQFKRKDGETVFHWAFESDLSLRHGDRIVDGTTYYKIVGIPIDRSNSGLADGPYVCKTIQLKNS